MSTDDMDARLQQAGERWRAHNSTIAAIDLAAATADDSGDASTMVPLVPDDTNRPRRRRWIWLSSAAGIAAAVAAVLVAVQLGGDTKSTPPPAGSSAALVGTQWQLTGLTNAAGNALAVPSSQLALDANHVLSWTEVCSAYVGHVELHATSMSGLRLTLAKKGEHSCPGSRAVNTSVAEHQVVVRVLTGTVQWSISGDTLTLTKPGVGTLVYRKPPPPAPITEPKALLGAWSLATLVTPGGTSASPAQPANLTFTGNHVDGTDGCNHLSGTVMVSPGRVDFGSIATTAMGCIGAGVSAESSAIAALLGRNVSWSVQDDRLTLSKDGAGSLVYVRTDVDPGFTGKTKSPTGQPSATATK